jgi:hypothetical protein
MRYYNFCYVHHDYLSVSEYTRESQQIGHKWILNVKYFGIQTWNKNIYSSTYPPPALIHLSHRFTRASNPQHTRRSLSTAVSATYAPPFQPFCHQRNICHVSRPSCEPQRQTLPIVNRKHFFMNILCIESFFPTKITQKTLLFSRTVLEHGSHFYY